MKVGDGTPGPGRPKGSKNRIQTQAKEAIAAAADALGGVERIVAWAREDPRNESVFWSTIYPKLVPLEVNGSHNVDFVDRTEAVRRAREEVRALFGDRPDDGPGAYGGGLPH